VAAFQHAFVAGDRSLLAGRRLSLASALVSTSKVVRDCQQAGHWLPEHWSTKAGIRRAVNNGPSTAANMWGKADVRARIAYRNSWVVHISHICYP